MIIEHLINKEELSLEECIYAIDYIQDNLLKRIFSEFDIIRARSILTSTLKKLLSEEDNIQLDEQEIGILYTFEKFCINFLIKKNKKSQIAPTTMLFFKACGLSLYNLHMILDNFREMYWISILNTLISKQRSLSQRMMLVQYLTTSLDKNLTTITESYSDKYLRDFYN